MPFSPKKAARKAAGLPKPPPVHGPGKPPPRIPAMVRPKVPEHEWRAMTAEQRIIVQLGLSQEKIFELLSIPFSECDLHEKRLQFEVWSVLTKAALRYGLEVHRDEERIRILDYMRRELDSERKEPSA